MGSIEEYVKHTIDMKDYAEAQEAMMVRFSLSLEDHTNRRLDYISKRLGLTKTEIIRHATELVVREFEKQLGLDWTDSEYKKVVFPSDKREGDKSND